MPSDWNWFVIATMIGNALIAVAKFVAGVLTGSAAMLAEAAHSLVAAGALAMLLFGNRRALRPADAAHPFGYGKELYFWAFVGSVLLFAIGAGLAIGYGAQRLMDPRPIENPTVAYRILALSLTFQLATLALAWRRFDRRREAEAPGEGLLDKLRRSRDPARYSVLFSGVAAIAGLIVALIGVYLSDRVGMLWADGAAAVAVGGVMALAAILSAAETRTLLVGEAADSSLVEDILGLAGQADFVDGVNEARTMHFGPMDVLVNLSVDARDELSAGAVELGAAELQRRIRARHPQVSRVFVEIQRAEDNAIRRPMLDGDGDGGRGAPSPA